ncbi:MAG: hypothetical protein COC16_00350 [Lutibacter sp.]|nr:MAG: hypothetical protein COC16_00350 [Lutibacter sp.]
MYYNSKKSFEIIETNVFLYFYDYYKIFDEPFFTKSIKFNNDYDKIIALQATNEFWDANYQFPKSFKALKSIEFLKEYGILINYENKIPTNDIEFIRPSVISWDKTKRLKWESVKQGLNESENSNKYINRNLSTNIKADKVYHSSSDIVKKNSFFNNYQSFNFSYLLDKHKDSNGENKFITRTIFDRNSSSYKNSRSKNMLVYLNLTFDIYEYYRQKLASEINDEMTFSQVKVLCNETFKKATQTVEKMKMETNSALNFQYLMRWNNEIKSKLDIDNYYLISNQK